MERKNVIKYKKIGGGTLLFKGRFIKENEIFEAEPWEVPNAFKDTILAIEPEKLKKMQVVKHEVGKYEKIAKGKGWFDIVDEQGKKINEKALRENDADEMLSKLNVLRG